MSVGKDFRPKNQFCYEGQAPSRPQTDDKDYEKKMKEFEGHGMLLVGVLKCGTHTNDTDMLVEELVAGNDVCCILQSFWEDKQFVMVRRDYFRGCTLKGGLQPSIAWVTNDKPEFPDAKTIHARPVGCTRVSLSPSNLEHSIGIARQVLIRWFDPSSRK